MITAFFRIFATRIVKKFCNEREREKIYLHIHHLEYNFRSSTIKISYFFLFQGREEIFEIPLTLDKNEQNHSRIFQQKHNLQAHIQCKYIIDYHI